MKIRKALQKKMEFLESSGRGIFYEGAGEGQVLCSTCLEIGRLDFYEDGFSFGVEGRTCKVLFDDVVVVKSHLNAELISSAGKSGCLDFHLPMDVKCKTSELALSVPFLAYSSVLNILVGLRKNGVRPRLFYSIFNSFVF